MTGGSPQLVAELKAEVGQPLRLVAEYEQESYTIHYFRGDVEQRYSAEEIDEIADDLVLQGLGRQRLEDLFDAGSLQCSMHTFDEATMCQFVKDDYGGLFLTFDTDSDVNVLRVVNKCKELVVSDDSE